MALKIGILGAGAIGASIARALYLNQVPFRLLTRSEARAREYNQTGIRFRSGKELTLIRLGVDQPHFAEEVRGRGDLDYLFLGMKTPALAASLPQAWRELGPEGRIVLLQNGLPEDTLPLSDRERERIVAGIVGYNVQRLSDGVFYQSNPGHLILGAAREPRDLALALGDHLPVVVTRNPAGYRFSKLAINCVINGLGAVSGQALGPIFFSRAGRQLAIAMITEAAVTMQALGIEEGIVPGTVSIRKFGQGGWPWWLQHLVLLVLGLNYRQIKTSMLQDIEAGRKTEVNEIHGALCDRALSAGVQSPVTGAIRDRVLAIEAGTSRPDPSFLRELVKRVL